MIASSDGNADVFMRQSAVWWATQGHHVLPLHHPITGATSLTCSCRKNSCTSPAKHPIADLVPNGLTDASNDPEVVADWWRRFPFANIGLRTGLEFDLLDIDGENGFTNLALLIEKLGGQPDAACIVESGRAEGGRHYYMRPAGKTALSGGKKGVPEGIDVKGAGGYVVAPPSQHISGNRYTWTQPYGQDSGGTVTWEQIYTELTSNQPSRNAAPPPRQRIDRNDPFADNDPFRDKPTFGQAVLERIISEMLEATTGNRWQTFATDCAFDIARAIKGGTLDRSEAESALADAAHTVGMEQTEIDRLPTLIDDALNTIDTPITAKPTQKTGAPPLTPPPTTPDDSPWQPPTALAGGDLPPFPTRTLGPELGEFVRCLAIDTQTPPDLGGMLTLAVLSAAVGKGARVHITSTWSEQLSLYVVIALPAGEGKSPVFKRLTEPLKNLEREAVQEALPAVTAAKQERRNIEARAKALEAKAAKGNGPDALDAYAEAQGLNLQLAQMPQPVAPRFFVDDVTSEALVQVLAEQDGQVALLSEEGGIFATLAGRYSGTPNLDAVLKAHDGGTIRVDRRTSDPLFVENPALTMGLAVQPSVLRSLADEEALRGRGLIARFLYSVPRSLVGSRDVRLRMTSTSSQPGFVHFEDAVARVYRARCISYKVCCSEDSLSLLTTFSEELERRRHRELGDLSRVMDWSAKLDGATARIAGLLALVDGCTSSKCTKAGCEDVEGHVDLTADHMQRAIDLARYLIRHAEAALDLMDPSIVDTEPAAQLLAWMRHQGLARISVREAHQALRGRHLFKKGEQVISAFAVLLEHGYLRRLPDPPQKAGRPASPAFDINPHDPEGEATR